MQIANRASDFAALIFNIKPQIERDLVVPAPRRVQFRARGADLPGQGRLNIHVHVFQCGVPLENAFLDLGFHLAQTFLDLRILIRGDESRGRER